MADVNLVSLKIALLGVGLSVTFWGVDKILETMDALKGKKWLKKGNWLHLSKFGIGLVVSIFGIYILVVALGLPLN